MIELINNGTGGFATTRSTKARRTIRRSSQASLSFFSMVGKLIGCALLGLPQLAHADIGVAVGFNLTYHGDVGITVKALSSDELDDVVFAVGATYYPFSENKTGFDIGVGRTAVLNSVFVIGVDVSNDVSYMSIGYVDLSSE